MHLYILLAAFSCGAAAIWPQPVSMTNGSTVLWFTKEMPVTINGASVQWTSPLMDTQDTKYLSLKQYIGMKDEEHMDSWSWDARDGIEIVRQATRRTLKTIESQSIIPWKQYPRNSLAQHEPDTTLPKEFIPCLDIDLDLTDTPANHFSGHVDETYELIVTKEGARIHAATYFGALHALQSFTQLFYQHSTNAGIYTNTVPVRIQDGPKFPHRALNMDVARNWFPKNFVLRVIDSLAWNKFNRLHLHITDAQSWPLDIPAMPELSRLGAYQDGLSYTPQDLEDIQRYALLRGMQVVLEIDMPGHTTAIAYAFPDLIAAAHALPWEQFCLEPPCGSLKLAHPPVYDFLGKLWSDVLPRVSPYTSYFHTGGDEVNLNSYTLDDSVMSKEKAVLRPLIQKLVDFNHAKIRAAGLAPIVWEEMLLEWNLDLGEDVLVQSWLDAASLAKITAAGHKAIGGSHSFWYLDCGRGQWLNFDNGPSFQTFYPFNDYCTPAKNWRLIYSYDPLAGIPPENQHLVLGAVINIWAEQTDPVNFDDMVWPRASAAGEVLWAGRQDAAGRNRSQIEAAPRLAEWRERMVARGVRAGPVQMVFCTQGHGKTCSL